MIRYASHGERAYGDRPMAPHTRLGWEFQAVVSGKLALWLPGQQIWRTATLWLFPPECSHGWTATPGSTCRICVIQIPTVPDLLRLLAAEHGYLEIPLTPEDSATVVQLTDEAAAIPFGDPLGGVRGDVIAARFSLLLAERLAEHLPERLTPRSTPEKQVGEAIAWLAQHLPERPTITEAAAVVGCSPAHLRRLFTQVRRQSPNEVLSELRLRRVEELLGDRTLTLEQIAQLTGFADGSTLSRAYRAARGQPPTRLSGRRQLVITESRTTSSE